MFDIFAAGRFSTLDNSIHKVSIRVHNRFGRCICFQPSDWALDLARWNVKLGDTSRTNTWILLAFLSVPTRALPLHSGSAAGSANCRDTPTLPILVRGEAAKRYKRYAKQILPVSSSAAAVAIGLPCGSPRTPADSFKIRFGGYCNKAGHFLPGKGLRMWQ